MCSCTKPLMFLFGFFILLQIYLRWQRDLKNLPKWFITVETHIQNIDVKQSLLLPFNNYSIIEGNAFSEIYLTNTSLEAKDDILLNINTYIKINAPPLSYHTVKMNHKYYYTQLNINGIGSINYNSKVPLKTLEKIVLEYNYDYAEFHGFSSIDVDHSITNGFV